MPAVDLLAAGTASLEIRHERNYVVPGRQGSHGTMDGQAYAQELTRQRIIERPRLTRLLDGSTSRIIMLVAPAGFGKTILARQWLAKRPYGWYSGSSATADVAALAIGMSQAAQSIVPGAGIRMIERLRATGTPEEDTVALAELLAEDLQDWPDDAWLAFDDYHFACRSTFSERFTDLLLALTRIRLLLTSRVRPRWATTRRLLYGELHEVGRTFLAMTDEEALEVLGERERASASGLVALAEGWPAVIGLASLTEGRDLPEEAVPAALYDYFAEELYQAASPETQWGLACVGLVPSVTEDLAEAILGEQAQTVVEDGVRLGIFSSPARGVYDCHPLLRTFLEAKFREAPPEETAPVSLKLGRELVGRERFDDAFDLIERFFSERLFVELVELALPAVLREGRVPTLDRWVDLGVSRGVDSPILNLAEAEINFRRGQRTRAESLALQAIRRLHADDPLRVRALLLAGTSAQLNNRLELAYGYYVEAQLDALTAADIWDAARGKAISAIVLERPDAADLVEEVTSLNDGSVEHETGLAILRFHYDSRLGEVANWADRFGVIAHLAPRIRNPGRRAAFVVQVATAYLHEGRYREARTLLRSEQTFVTEERIGFALPYLSLYQARAELGLRNFARALQILNRLERKAVKHDDSRVMLEVLLARNRIYMAEGVHDRALEALDEIPHYDPPRGEYGEYLIGRALVLACQGDLVAARGFVAEATDHTRLLQVRALSACVLAILALEEGGADPPDEVETAVMTIQKLGDVDSFVYAYRSYPALLEAAARDTSERRWLWDVVQNARDEQLAARCGLAGKRKPSRRVGVLSSREREVLDLVAQGLTNRQIARALWISDSTVKVHMRHIFEKLEVRTRVEAAMKARAISD